MARLRDLGIKIAIDDFGTGYSSLSYLKNWRVDALKIDRSFVRDLVTDSSDLAIVSAIIAIARHLHIQVIAEGIEAYQQAEILRRLGCSVGQGFLFARPMPADQMPGAAARVRREPAKEEEEDMLAVFSAGRAWNPRAHARSGGKRGSIMGRSALSSLSQFATSVDATALPSTLVAVRPISSNMIHRDDEHQALFRQPEIAQAMPQSPSVPRAGRRQCPCW